MSCRAPGQALLRHLEVPALLLVPAVMLACAYLGLSATGGLTLVAALLSLALFLAHFEASAPTLRQVVPAATLGGVAAAGRVLFAPIPDVKPVSAIAIVAGATLGRESGFMVGALAALVSNFFFGQGAWTPLQMYAWGLVGYLSGVLADAGAFPQVSHPQGPFNLAAGKPGSPQPAGGGAGSVSQPAGGAKPAIRTRLPFARLYLWGFLSGLLYGLVLNSWYVLGYVRPLEPAPVLAAFAAGLPLDIVHGVATVGFLALIWLPWGRAIRRAVAKYDL